MDPRIEEYIRNNRRTYTREAIREQLIEAGHDPAAIDATWEMMHAPDPDEAGVAGAGFWGRFFLFIVGLNVAVWLLVGLSTGMLAGIGTGSGVLLIVLAVALGIGALIAWGIVAAVGPEKMGRTTAMVIGGLVPVVFAFLIGGSCYALASAIGPPPPPPLEGTMEVSFGEPLDFNGSGPAFCQIYEGPVGFDVFSQELGTVDGRAVSASVGSFSTGDGAVEGPTPAPAPGLDGGVQRTLNVALLARSENQPPVEWFVGPGSVVDMDVAPDALSGTVTFTGLYPIEEGPAPLDPNEPPEGSLDGTISWTCQ